MKVLDNLKYSKDHEWVIIDGDVATIGITDFAQSELGDIVYVDIDTIGDTLKQNDVFGTVEAVKTVSDLFMPISGTILAVNDQLDSNPENINQDAYGTGWIVKVKISDITEIDNLLDAPGYVQMVKG